MAAAPQKKSSSQKISKPAVTRRNASFLRSPRGLWFAFTLLLFGLFTFLAHRQAPRPDPFQPVQTLSWDWWQYPLERNAFKRLPVITSNLNDVFALPNSEKVWAVGGKGMIVHSEDGGETWMQQEVDWEAIADKALTQASQEQQQVDSMEAFDARQQNALRANIAQKGSGPTSNQANAPLRPPVANPVAPQETPPELRSVHFVDTTNGWAVGENGTILATSNGGASWQAQTNGTTRQLESVHFVNATTGWAVGGYRSQFLHDNTRAEGLIIHTTDGGATWQTQMRSKESSLYSVHFVNVTTGWVVGDNGTILVTSNRGVTWQMQESKTTSWFKAVYFVNMTTGWAVGFDYSGHGIIIHTTDAGATWQVQNRGVGSALESVFFADPVIGWAVGGDLLSDGKILNTIDSGASWQVQASETRRQFNSVCFASATTGWAVSRGGTILATEDGGESWVPKACGILDELGKGSILADSATATFDRIRNQPYSHSFAPWYFLALLLVVLFLYPAFKRPMPVETEQKTVADLLISDSPISHGKDDRIEFNAIARGLSRFLRNENTQPPLTIAITGEWGSGKSSLMNLLKADLERYGFRPVWFNAWHHQKEEHLLAALLENIRKQAVPPLWHLRGIGFRLRLFWGRIRRHRMLALLLSVSFAVATGYFASEPNRLDNAVHQLKSIFANQGAEEGMLNWVQEKLKSLGSSNVLTLLSGIGAVLLVLWRGLRAFGMNPANLMTSLSNNFNSSKAKAQLGFRHDFMQEFKEVTAALRPKRIPLTMTILIDDLDRCRPENVLEVLEAVNFLVSSGDCYVVMGLDLTRVERCVGLGFKDVAEELIDDPEEEDRKGEGKVRRAEFARQYLEKLINIEVPVPQPQSAQSQNLIVPPQPVAPKPLTWWQNLLQISAPVVRKVAPVLLVAAVLVGSMWFSMKYFSPQRETPGATTVAQVTVPATTSPTQPTPSTPTPSPQRETPIDSSRGPGELIQPVKEPTSFTFVYIALAIMLGFGIWRLSIPTDLVVKDSPEFIDALKIWHPLLIAKRNTPRSVKRFVNRVRYFAMRQSAEREEKSVWQKFAVWAGFKQKEEAKHEEAVSESILVALSAIHHAESELIDPTTLANLMTYLEGKRVLGTMELPPNTGIPEGLKGVLINSIAESIQKHIERFGNWPPNEEDRRRLEKLSAGIRLN